MLCNWKRIRRYTCKTSQQTFCYKLFNSIAIMQKQSLVHKVTEVPTRFTPFATKLMCDPKQAGINTWKQWCLSDSTWIGKKRQKVKGQFTDLNLRQIPAYNLALSFNSLFRNILTFIMHFVSVNQLGFSIASKQQKIPSENQGVFANSVWFCLYNAGRFRNITASLAAHPRGMAPAPWDSPSSVKWPWHPLDPQEMHTWKGPCTPVLAQSPQVDSPGLPASHTCCLLL